MCRAVHDVAERRSLAIVGDGFGGLKYVPVERGGFGRFPMVMGEQSGRTISLSNLLAQVPEGPRRAELLSAVTDASPSIALERAGVINWNPRCTKLVALRVSRGSCPPTALCTKWEFSRRRPHPLLLPVTDTSGWQLSLSCRKPGRMGRARPPPVDASRRAIFLRERRQLGSP